jgi:hypothetical protein
MSSNVFNSHILSNMFLTVYILYQGMHILLYIFVIWIGCNMDQTFLMMDPWNPKPAEAYMWVINNLLLNYQLCVLMVVRTNQSWTTTGHKNIFLLFSWLVQIVYNTGPQNAIALGPLNPISSTGKIIWLNDSWESILGW